MINKVTILGNLGADPELRTSGGGLAICKLRVATTSRVKRGDQWEDVTEWHRVTCFGNTAENANKYLSKGRQVYIEGRIQTSKYQDKDGNDRYSTEIVANEVKFLGGKDAQDRGQSDSRSSGRQERGGGYQGSMEDAPF